MAELKILSWNVEHFDGKGGLRTRGNDRVEVIKARKDRFSRVVDTIQNENPDVFGISEVESGFVYDDLRKKFSNYAMHITEGRQSQNILVGVKGTLTPFFTQKTEFKRSNPHLRPAVLATVHPNEETSVQVLFTHLKSSPTPEGFGLRDAMLEKIFRLKNTLNKAARRIEEDDNAKANFIVVGDMNTMGMDYEKKKYDILGADEIQTIITRMKRRNMAYLPKNHPATFSNGSNSSYPDSDLDHFFAAKHLEFKPVNDDSDALVHVGGWPEQTTAAKKDSWIKQNSDHGYLVATLKI